MITSTFILAIIASLAISAQEPEIFIPEELPAITIPAIIEEPSPLDEMREQYPNGYEWDSTRYYKWNAKSNFVAGEGCGAFAFMLSDAVGNAGDRVTKIFEIDTIRANDIAIINNNTHAVFVLDVDYYNRTFTVAEGNYMGVVRWDGVYNFDTINYILRREEN